MADAFNRLQRSEEFQAFMRELDREQGFIVDQLTVSAAESFDHYQSLRGQWLGLEAARGLVDSVMGEAADIQGGEDESGDDH